MSKKVCSDFQKFCQLQTEEETSRLSAIRLCLHLFVFLIKKEMCNQYSAVYNRERLCPKKPTLFSKSCKAIFEAKSYRIITTIDRFIASLAPRAMFRLTHERKTYFCKAVLPEETNTD